MIEMNENIWENKKKERYIKPGFQFDGEYPCELSHKGPIFQPFILFILPVGKRK